MLTAEGVTAVKSSTLDQVASLDRVAIQGIEIADICIVLTFALQPKTVFCPWPNPMSRHAQPLRTQQLSITPR